ncbi:MAG TPA: DUF5939 domain-containing protein [Myxococcaceae bacterium]|nr:DUF5939 domain-containing protein [Myxococcaceae bacterium]
MAEERSGGEVEVVREVDCTAPLPALWRVLSDTDRWNRAVRMGSVQARPWSDGGSAARYLVKTRLDGFNVEYEELPFEWVENERFFVHRKMRGGPVQSLAFGVELRGRGDGVTTVRFSLRLAPRFRFLVPLIRRSAQRSLATMVEEIRRVDTALRIRTPLPTLKVKRAVHPEALDRALSTLRSVIPPDAQPLATRLGQLVSEAEDAALTRIRPFEWAEAWGVPRQDVLTLALEAVKAGVLELSWDVVCPSCRTASSRLHGLNELSDKAHCQLCDLGFEVTLDRQVEATFRPNPSVRTLRDELFCIGGPSRTPHVFAQVVAVPGREATLPVPQDEGTYRLFARGGEVVPVEVREGTPGDVAVTLGSGAPRAAVTIAPGGTLHIRLAGSDDRHVKLERTAWAHLAATAHHVALTPQYRRLFTHDVLRPNILLKVTRVALLFTDLTGSTELYARVGDAGAYQVVQDHFALLDRVVRGHGGVVIKTMGDAVMAAFSEEESAVRAARECLSAFEGFKQRQVLAPGLGIKVGLFAGPSFAVTANQRLDYFGQTVNVAARLQNEARAGELILPQDLAELARACGWLEGASTVEAFEAALKGVSGPFRAVRVR